MSSPRTNEASIFSSFLAILLSIRLERSAGWSCSKRLAPIPRRHDCGVNCRQPPGGRGYSGLQRRLALTRLSKESPPTSVSRSDDSIYNCPELYDLAFGYRAFDSEVDFLLNVHRLAQASSNPKGDRTSDTIEESPQSLSVLELAAGPAQHALTALRYTEYGVSHATALDASPSMAAYALQLLEEDLDDDDGEKVPEDEVGKDDMKSRFDYVVGDMRHFEMNRTFDTAWILLGSMQHMLTADDAIGCFQSAHAVLKPRGTLIVELPHPQEVLGVVECTRNEWTVPLDGLDESDSTKKVVIVWGDEDDPLDPVAQVRDFTIEFKTYGCEEKEWKRLGLTSPELRQVVPLRLYTAGEVDALGRCAGFRLARMYGALEAENLVDINDEDQAFRMVCVLQKV